jgi:hypothetical protein
MRLLRGLFASLVFAVAPLSAAPVNLVTNPDFAGSLTGWTSNFVSFDGAHSATADGTGSALGSWTLPKGAFNGIANGMTQCITPVTPGTAYFFGGKMLIPGGQSGSGGGVIDIQWYSATNCLGFITNSGTPAVTQPGDTPDTWHSVSGISVAPGGAGSILMIGGILNSSGELQTFDVSFDEIYLSTEPVNPPVSVPAATPLALGLLGVSLAAAAIPLLRRG